MASEQASRLHGELHTGTVVRGTSVRLSSDSARVGVPGQEPAAEPRIEITRTGDVIQAIDIICGCGEHIRLHCRYEN
jgi:hypothetical protein